MLIDKDKIKSTMLSKVVSVKSWLVGFLLSATIIASFLIMVLSVNAQGPAAMDFWSRATQENVETTEAAITKIFDCEMLAMECVPMPVGTTGGGADCSLSFAKLRKCIEESEKENTKLQNNEDWNRYKAEKKKEEMWHNVQEATATTFKRALQAISQQIAYETAVWLASGGKGQQPLYITEGLGKYLQNIGDQVLGTWVDEVMQSTLNLSVCQPNFNIRLGLILPLIEKPDAFESSCSLTQMFNNWDQAVRNARVDFSVDMQKKLYEESDIVYILKAREELTKKQAFEVETKRTEAASNKFFQGVKDVSGFIVTPGSYVGDQLGSLKNSEGEWKNEWTGTLIDAGITFADTLSSQLLKTYVKGFFSLPFGSSNRYSAGRGIDVSRYIYDSDSSSDRSNLEGAKTQFANLLEGQFGGGYNYNILSQLSVCPEGTNSFPGPTECVMDNDFSNSIRNKTVLINLSDNIKNRVFSPRSQVSGNYKNTFTLRNILIMRKHRIVPVGWEIAAQYIAQYSDKDYTLRDLMDNFDNPSSEFYGLVDPYWVLKVPETFCRRDGFGPDLDMSQRDSISRTQYCADEQQCIKEDDDGKCLAYGYCTEEARTWNFAGKSCDPIFNTCQSFASPGGTTQSYLANTLDYRYCNAQNAGCLWYSSAFNPVSSEWLHSNPSEVLNTCDDIDGCLLDISGTVDYGRSILSVGAGRLVLSESCTNLDGCEYNNISCTVPYGGNSCSSNMCLNDNNIVGNLNYDISVCADWNADDWVEGFQDVDNRWYCNLNAGVTNNALRFVGQGVSSDLSATLGGIAVEANQRYNVSFYARGSITGGGINVGVEAGSVLGSLLLNTGNISGDWRKYEFVFDNQGANTVTLSLLSSFNAGGSVYFDDFVIQKFDTNCQTDQIKLTLGATSETNKDIFFDRDAQSCDAGGAGCSQFIRTQAGLSSNLIPNSDFALDDNGNGIPDGWSSNGIEWDGDKIKNGWWSNSGGPEATDDAEIIVSNFRITLFPNTYYYLSASASQVVDSANLESRADIRLHLCDSDGFCNQNNGTNGDAEAVEGSCILEGFGDFKGADLVFMPKDFNMESSGCWFKTNDSTVGATVELIGRSQTDNADELAPQIWFDDLKLEEISYAQAQAYGDSLASAPYSAYNPSQRPANQLAYLKKAPDYYQCYNAPATGDWPVDQTELASVLNSRLQQCDNFAEVCIADEVGCQLYTPTSGDPAVPGKITANDLCPSECVGYQIYKQEPTYYTSAKFNQFIADDVPKYCPANASGCDEFTNLDEVALGGEGLEYYVRTRSCQKPDGQSNATYYTWEGSDTTGYQLRVYEFKKSAGWDASAGVVVNSINQSAPCTNLSYYQIGDPLPGQNYCNDLTGLSDLQNRNTSLHNLITTAMSGIAPNTLGGYLSYLETANLNNSKIINQNIVNGLHEFGVCAPQELQGFFYYSQRWGFDGADLADNTGLTAGNDYRAQISVNGQSYDVDFTATGNETYSDIVVAIDNALDAVDPPVEAVWEQEGSNGYITIREMTAQNGTFIEINDDNLFDSMNLADSEAEDVYVAIRSNPDCRAFYDVGSSISHRLLSRTITISEDCHPYRRTATQGSESTSCPALGAGVTVPAVQCDCASSGGFWNEFGECVYMAVPGEGVSCQAQYAGCREYTGNQGNNVRNVLVEDFEFGATGWTGGTISSEASYPGGNSLRVTGLSSTKVGVGSNKSYHLSFWAKGESSFDLNAIKFSGASSQQDHFAVRSLSGIDLVSSIVRVTDEWQKFDLGPVFVTWDASQLQDLIFDAGVGNVIYIDNVTLKEIRNNIFLVENSWFTPFSCDNNLSDPDGQKLVTTDSDSCFDGSGNALLRCRPGEMLGCSAYDNQAGQRYNLKSFEELCRPEAVGCEALIDTSNSNYPFVKDYNKEATSVYMLPSVCNNINGCSGPASGPYPCTVAQGNTTCFYNDPTDDLTVSADKWVYLVNSAKHSCGADNKGCTIYGLPTVTGYDEVVSYNTVYVKNQPDRYSTDLCQNNALWCNEFSSGNSASYFKDPRDKVCEYRKQSGQNLAGWYQKGTTLPCDVSPYQTIGLGVAEGKLQPAGWYNNQTGGYNVNYDGWVGACPATQSSCTEFIDPDHRIYNSILFNGSFDLDIDSVGAPDGWSGVEGYQDAGGGNWRVKGATQDITLRDHTLYTVSARASTDITLNIECGTPSNRTTLMWSPDASMTRSNSYNMSLIRTGLSADTPVSGRFYVESPVSCQLRVASNTGWVDDVRLVPTGVYYGLANTVDSTGCNGLYDFQNGCILFNDRGEINYKALAFGDRVRDNYLSFDVDATGNKQPQPTSPSSVIIGDPNNPNIQQKNTNVVLKVVPDRQCYSWLYCDSYIKSDTNSASSDFGINDQCFGLGLCYSLGPDGNCNSFDFGLSQDDVGYTKADVNKTGYSRLGAVINGRTVEGYSPFYDMSQLGESASVANGGFEFVYEGTSEPLGWYPANDNNRDPSWYEYKFKVDTDPRHRRDSLGYLKVNSAYEVMSDVIQVEGGIEYYVGGWVNTLDLYPEGSKAQILIKEIVPASSDLVNGSCVEVDGCTVLDNQLRDVYGNTEVNWQLWPDLTLGAGANWQYIGQKITTHPNTKQLQIRLMNYHTPATFIACSDNNPDIQCLLSGSSRFDDIEIRPVLQVSKVGGSTKEIARNCRLYPERDSRDCAYLERGNFYYGWYGYCLLQDPENSDVCLQWWPVDTIKGSEVDEFAVSYEGDVPLYYCAEQTGLVRMEKTFDWAASLSGKKGKIHNFDNECKDFWATFRVYNSDGSEDIVTVGGQQSGGAEWRIKDDLGQTHWIARCSGKSSTTWYGRARGWAKTSITYVGPQRPDEPTFATDSHNFYSLPFAQLLCVSNPFGPKRVGDEYSIGGDDCYCSSNVAASNIYNNSPNAVTDELKCARIYPTSCVDTFVSDSGNTRQCDRRQDPLGRYCQSIYQTVTPIGINKTWNTRVNAGSKFRVMCNPYDGGSFRDDSFTCGYEDFNSPFGALSAPAPTNNPNQWTNVNFGGYQGRFLLPSIDPLLDYWSAEASFRWQLYGNSSLYSTNNDPYSNDKGLYADQSLKRLFVRSYGLWSWSTGSCQPFEDVSGRCSNNPTQACSFDSDCVVSAGSCVLPSAKVCRDGVKAGDPQTESCTLDSDCYDASDCVDSGTGTKYCAQHTDGWGSGAPGTVEGPLACIFSADCWIPVSDDCSGGACAPGTDNEGASCSAGSDCWNQDSFLCSARYECSNNVDVNCGYYDANSNYLPDNNICNLPGTCKTGLCEGTDNFLCNNDSECAPPDDGPMLGYVRQSGKLWDVPTLRCREPGPDEGGPFLDQRADPSQMQNEYCYIAPRIISGSIKVNDKPSHTIDNGSGVVKLSFNVSVDPDQLPLTSYSIDWGDGTKNSISGVSLRSRLNLDNPFLVYHYYDYLNLKARDASSVAINCTSGPDQCTVRVTITVQDSWDKRNINDANNVSGLIIVKP